MSKIEAIQLEIKEIETTKSQIMKQLETTTVEFEKESLNEQLTKLDKMLSEKNLSFHSLLKGMNTSDMLKKLLETYPQLQIHWNVTESIGKKSSFKDINYLILKAKAEKGELNSACIQGPTGTGKTTVFRRLGYELNKPIISVNCSLGLDEEALFGQLMPQRGADGKMEVVWVDGPITLAAKAGVGIILEEINGAKESILMKLNMVMDNLRMMEYKPGHYIQTAPGFFIGGTLNHGYGGTRPINLALANRFEVSYIQKQHSKNKLADILRLQLPDATEDEINLGWYIFDEVDYLLESGSFNGAISVRQIINTIKTKRIIESNLETLDKISIEGKVAYFGSWQAATVASVANQIGAFDPEIYACIENFTKVTIPLVITQKGGFVKGTLTSREKIAEAEKKKKGV